jgi:hypothetical protein
MDGRIGRKRGVHRADGFHRDDKNVPACDFVGTVVIDLAISGVFLSSRACEGFRTAVGAADMGKAGAQLCTPV